MRDGCAAAHVMAHGQATEEGGKHPAEPCLFGSYEGQEAQRAQQGDLSVGGVLPCEGALQDKGG